MDGPKEALSSTDEVQVKERRKDDWPIMYAGDAADPCLTSAERRAIRRRVANRESARRSRLQRQVLSDIMTTQVRTLEEVNARLRSENEELQNGLMQLGRENKAIRESHAERSPHLPAPPSVSIQGKSTFANSINLFDTSVAGQRSQCPAPASVDDDIVPADFMRNVVLGS